MVLLVLVLTSCDGDDPPPPPPPPPSPIGGGLLHQDGPDDARLDRWSADLSVTDMEQEFGGAEFVLVPASDTCGTATSTELGLTAVTDDVGAVRAFVVVGQFETPEGIGVDSTVQDVQEAYGDAVVAAEQGATGTQVVVEDLERRGEQVGPESMVYVFDVDEAGVVTTLRAGQLPWVLGCSESADTPPPSPSPPTPSPTPPPPEAPTATFSGVGDLQLGSSVDEAGAALGVDFDDVEPLNDSGDCGLARAPLHGLALVVATPGGVQAVVVARPDILFVEATGTPVGVGDTVAEVRAAFPRFASGDDEESLAGGERVVIAPQELPGRALLMEADAEGVIRQFRVGVDDYALQVDYCTTPW